MGTSDPNTATVEQRQHLTRLLKRAGFDMNRCTLQHRQLCEQAKVPAPDPADQLVDDWIYHLKRIDATKLHYALKARLG